jgi:hypothetical protein
MVAKVWGIANLLNLLQPGSRAKDRRSHGQSSTPLQGMPPSILLPLNKALPSNSVPSTFEGRILIPSHLSMIEFTSWRTSVVRVSLLRGTLHIQIIALPVQLHLNSVKWGC